MRLRSIALVALALSLGLTSCSTARRLNPFVRADRDQQDPTTTGERIPLALADQITVSPELQGATFSLPPAQTVATWPTPGGVPGQLVQHAASAANFQVAWRRRFGDGSSREQFITAPPISAGGRVYVMDAGAQVSALDPATGAVVWQANLGPGSAGFDFLPAFNIPFIAQGGGEDVQTFGGGLAFDSGRLYVTSGYRFVAALDAANGALVWRTPVASPIHAAPMVSGGRIFAVNTNNELQTFNTTTGQLGWQYQALLEPARILQANSPAVSGDTVIAAFASGELIALQSANGNQLWAGNLISGARTTALSEIRDIAGRPVVAGDEVIAGSHAGEFASIDLRSGAPRWRLPVVTTATPWVAGDVVYIVSKAGEVICVSRQTGQVYWIQDLNAGEGARSQGGLLGTIALRRREIPTYWTGVVLASGRLVTVSSKGQAVALDPMTGAVQASINLGAPALITPVPVGDLLYVVLDNGTLAAIR
jgi:outer membrane protein assembly factor BamB